MPRRLGIVGGLLMPLLLLGGCSITPVAAWEKGDLARRSMAFDGGLESAMAEHIYASREAAAGQSGVGATGCGCN